MERPNKFEVGEIFGVPNSFVIQLTDESGVRLGSACGVMDPYSRCVKLESIEVSRNMRRQGIGSKIIQKLVNYAKGQGADLIVGKVLPFSGSSYEEVCSFYKRNGFQVDNDGILFKDLTEDPSEE